MEWANLNPILRKRLIAIENGGSRSITEAVRLKKKGIKRGVSDLLLAHPLYGYHGLWVELKRNDRNAKVSEEQIAWLEDMNSVGYKAVLCYGFDEAKKAIENYLLGIITP